MEVRLMVKGLKLVALALALVVAACDEDRPSENDAGVDAEPDAEVDTELPDGDSLPDGGESDGDVEPIENAFTAASRPDDGALWLEGEVGDDGLVTLELWGERLGSVFGFVTHIGFDAEHLDVVGDTPLEHPEVLGADGASTARYLATVEPTEVSFGGTLVSPELAEVSIDGPTRLATLHLQASSAGRSSVTLHRTVVRRADGSFVELGVAGGEVSFGGGGS